MLWVLAALQIWIADESDKVRPDARPPAVALAPRIHLAAAGGECVGAQLVVRVPRGVGPARLAGSVRLSWRGGGADVPVEVRVRAFDLPATPALATAFGFSGYSAAKGHGRNVDAARELTRAYDLIALRRGIT